MPHLMQGPQQRARYIQQGCKQRGLALHSEGTLQSAMLLCSAHARLYCVHAHQTLV